MKTADQEFIDKVIATSWQSSIDELRSKIMATPSADLIRWITKVNMTDVRDTVIKRAVRLVDRIRNKLHRLWSARG